MMKPFGIVQKFQQIVRKNSFYASPKGSLLLPKQMNFWKSLKGGWGSFPIQKVMLQNVDLYKGIFQHKMDTQGSFRGMFSTIL